MSRSCFFKIQSSNRYVAADASSASTEIMILQSTLFEDSPKEKSLEELTKKMIQQIRLLIEAGFIEIG